MARFGYRYPRYCPLTISDDGTETLGAGKSIGKGVRAEVTININDVKMYGDDALAEGIKSFKDGTAAVTVDDLSDEAYAGLTGAKIVDEELVSKEDDIAPFVRLAWIRRKMKNNKLYYIGICYTKVQFGIPSETDETQGEDPTLQPELINGSLYRNTEGIWRRSKKFEELEDAVAYINSLVNYAEPTPSPGG